MSINLKKEQKFEFNLVKSEIINQVYMGIGWDPADEDEEIDLDASCVVLDAENDFIDLIYFGKLLSKDEAIKHLGDNLTGDGEGDDEAINVNLKELNEDAHSIFFTITSYSGQSFEELKNCVARLVNADNGKEMCRYELNSIGDHTAVIMCKLSRQNGGWEFKALGIGTEGESADDLIEEIEELD